MYASIHFRLVALALTALAVLLALPAGPTAAATDKVIRENYSGSVEAIDACGLTADLAWQGTFRATIHEWVIGPNDPPADNFWIGNINDHGSETWTNTANGKSVVRTWVVNVKEASMVDIGEGYWEYTYAVSGPVIRFGDRPVDVGRIVITDTLYLGDLSDESDFQFIGSTALADAGRHPAYYDSAPFCDALIAAIG
jgi:hypothetical protein